MPFQSEKQRRYLWANEPEIARDWTDTYGSGIAKALGGRIGFRRGTSGAPGGGDPGMSSSPSAAGQTHSGGGGEWSPGVGGTQHIPTPKTPVTTGGDRIIDLAQRQKRQDIRDLLARQQAEKDYTRKGVIKPGPQRGLGFAGSGGLNLGSMASGFAGSKIGGGLGSMLFGPWGALLGALFGRGVGKRGWQARQTPKRETWKDIAFGENTLLSNLFSKKKTPTGEGLGGIDLSNMDYDKLKTIDTSRGMYGFPYSRERPGGIDLSNMDYDKLKTIDPRMGMYGPRALGLNPNDLSSIEGQEAKVIGPALIQMRVLEKKKSMSEYGGPELTPDEERKLNRLKEMDAEETVYKNIIT